MQHAKRACAPHHTWRTRQKEKLRRNVQPRVRAAPGQVRVAHPVAHLNANRSADKCTNGHAYNGTDRGAYAVTDTVAHCEPHARSHAALRG